MFHDLASHQGNEFPATPSRNINSQGNITTEEANAMQIKDNNIICSLEKMVSEESLSKVEDNLKQIITEQVTKNQEKLESQIEKVVKQHQTYAELVKKDIAKEIAQQSDPSPE